ncbi:rhomboid family intramembrane serine protease [Streptococcus dentiloxodontae]
MQVTNWRKTPVTVFLVGVTAFVFISQYFLFGFNATSPINLFKIGAMWGNYVQHVPSSLWRLVTPIFIHIGLQHFLFNIITLYFLGQMAEQIFGSLRFFIFYLLSGIMGNAFTLLLTPDAVAAGASTSLFGLFAAIVVLGYFGRNPYLKQLGRSYAALIILNLLFNLITPGVGIVGHLGGLVGGALAAVFIPNQVESNTFSKIWQATAFAAYIALLAAVLVYVYVLQ